MVFRDGWRGREIKKRVENGSTSGRKMNSRNSSLNENESDFCRLIQEIRAGRVLVDVLFENETFEKRLRLITMAHATTAQDARELANEVRFTVWQKLQHFKPNPSYPYEGFFSWVHVLTRNIAINNIRRRKKFDQQSIEDLDIADPHADVESSFLHKQMMAELEKIINALPERERLTIVYYLQGFTSREISEKISQAGFSFSHVNVRNRIKQGLIAFWKADQGQDIKSRNRRVTSVRATRAKREFHTIVDHAINSGTAAIVPEPLASDVKRKTVKTMPPGSQVGWQSANELLKNMQSRGSKQGIQAAFDASPAELGKAAVEHAKRGRQIPLGSLTTYLIASSTANVVEKVMNLSQDAA